MKPKRIFTLIHKSSFIPDQIQKCLDYTKNTCELAGIVFERVIFEDETGTIMKMPIGIQSDLKRCIELGKQDYSLYVDWDIMLHFVPDFISDSVHVGRMPNGVQDGFIMYNGSKAASFKAFAEAQKQKTMHTFDPFYFKYHVCETMKDEIYTHYNAKLGGVYE